MRSCVRTNGWGMNGPRASDLIRETFAVPDQGVWVERHGITVRGERPGFIGQPFVRGDEFGPPIEDRKVVVAASKAKRK